MTSGAELFFRYARPPNQLGYCGPDDMERVAAFASAGRAASSELAALAEAFTGAWPYLSLMSEMLGVGPLDRRVVESYWLGPTPDSRLDVNAWGNSVRDRFANRAGVRWDRLSGAINSDGFPSHAFHVFCVYPWVGLLREGHVEPSLHVLDQCRVSLGSVIEGLGDSLIIRRAELDWVNDRLELSDPVVEKCANPYGLDAESGNLVAIHWGIACQVLSAQSAARLADTQVHHLRLANIELTTARLEPAR